MKEIIYYTVFAERAPGYGRSYTSNFLQKKNAETAKQVYIKKHVGKGEPYMDGYYADDWNIEENELYLNDG